jgi:hypothetical protein
MSLREHVAWINAQPWRPVSTAGLLVACVLVAAIGYFAWFGDGWVPLVDDANFAVHEAGHPLVGLFSERLAVYGGTLAQLAFPAVCMVEFWRRREALSCALCGVWLGQSLLNVARYVADARAMRLPLAGFGEHPLHDWNLILSRWGLLREDGLLADGLRIVAWLGIAAALGFAVRRWRESRRR